VAVSSVCVRVAVRGWWRRLEWLRRNGASPGGFIASLAVKEVIGTWW
jgi:hypothetical protein